MRKYTLILSVFAATAYGQADLNYHSGISLTFAGTHEQDYLIEPYYSDTRINSRATVYIRSATQISATHNALNVEADGDQVVIGAAGGGVIRYKVDGDLNNSWRWSVANQVPAYSSPLTFATLQYPGTSTAVLGSIGGNGQAITSKSTYYHYGLSDGVDEWHTITFADDDDALSTNPENKASDSKVWLFCVNPNAPALLPSATGNAQFYTTPAKIYYAPVLHAPQTTYFAAGSGTFALKLVDLYGRNISYKIGAAAAVNAGASSVTLSASDFSAGSQVLEVWVTANESYKRTRTIVKDPAFPSAGEEHGNLVFADAAEYSDFVARLGRTPYSTRWSAIQTNNVVAGKDTWDTYRMGGYRSVPGAAIQSKMKALPNAMAALVNGWTAVPSGKVRSWATYAKEMLLENPWRNDPVGWETDWNSRECPAREVIGAGYYTAKQLIDMAAAYDLLIAHFKSTQVAGGITAIEDLFIRDTMASAVFHTLQYYGGFTGFADPGMWGSSLAVGSQMIMFAMPDYDTPFYGTSGANGTTAASHDWTPFPTDIKTWWDIFIDAEAGTGAYPNLRFTYDGDILMNASGYWAGEDSIGYWSGNTGVSYITSVLHNTLAIHAPTREWPETRLALLNSVSGVMEQTGAPGVDLYYPCLAVLNRRFADIAAIGIPAAVARSVDLDQELYRMGPLSVIWYDDMAAGSQSASGRIRRSGKMRTLLVQ